MAVQANWRFSSLLLWEDTHHAEAAPSRLRAFVGSATGDDLLASAAAERTIDLWLPAEGRLVRTSVAGIEFSPSEAIDLLHSLPCSLPEECGDSVRYWAALARFVVAHVRRQMFFPGAGHEGLSLIASWQILLSGREEIERVERFALSMPPSCRAQAGGDPPDPLALVESFFSDTTDALVRRAAANDPFFTRVHSLAAAPSAPSEVRWVAALLGADRTVRGDTSDNAFLAEQIQAWVGPLDEPAESGQWKVGFTLNEPQEPEAAEAEAEGPEDAEAEPAPGALVPAAPVPPAPDRPWNVSFQLQASADGSTVEASEVWGDGNGSAGLLGRTAAERRAVLASELERAAAYFPPLTRMLATPSPGAVELSTAEAHLFLRQWSQELRENGFAVALPDWADERERQLGMVMALAPAEELDVQATGRRSAGARLEISPGRMGLESLLRFDWRIALGGLELSPPEFEDLVRQQSPLVRHRGKWIQIDVEAADAAADMLRRNPTGRITLAEAFRTAYGAAHEQSKAPILRLTGSSWVQQLLEQLPHAKAEALPQPASFLGTLRPYQLRGLQWLAFLDGLGIGSCLADDMGLGKTIQLIALLLHERREGRQPGPTLLFAPTSVVGNWVKELERFAPTLRTLLHHGPLRRRGDELIAAAAAHDVLITSYALSHRDLDDFRRVPWHRIALDEAQKIKNPAAASSVAIRSIASPHRVAMTGTPIENHLSELWSIMDMLNPSLLGTAREFRERFAVPIEKLADRDRANSLRQLIRPFVLRRTKTDPELAGDLPEKMEMKVFCSLTPEQAALYERITGQMLAQIDQATGIRRRGLILGVLTRLKQICDHPALLSDDRDTAPLNGRSGKCERLAEMLEEVIEEGENALVFTQYREMGHLLERMLPERLGKPLLFLHGGTPARKRDEMIRKFQDAGNTTPVFLLSLRAGGLGLNLTAASHVFHFDRWWNPAVEAQATDRAHRIGQSRRVQVHKFISLGTVEERIDKLLAEKTQLAGAIVTSGDAWLTSLSTDELRQHLALSEQAVGEED